MLEKSMLLIAAQSVPVIAILYLLVLAGYRLFLHPLSRLPGPMWYAVSSVPKRYDLVKGNATSAGISLHSKYGRTIRVAPDEVSTIDPRAWQDVYGFRKGNRGNFQKDLRWFYRQNFARNGAADIITADMEDHGRLRRIFSHAFSEKALREQEPILKHYTDLMIDRMQDCAASKSHVDMVQFYDFVTFDAISDLTFGSPMDLLDNMGYNTWVRDISEAVKMSVIGNAMRDYPLLEHALEYLAPKELLTKFYGLLTSCFDRVDARIARTDHSHPDFWTQILSMEGPKSLTLAEMHSNGLVFMTAGSETSATALCGLTYYLCKHPKALARLTAEVREAFATAEDITMQSAAKVVYLQPCIDEALRLYPPASVGLPRVVPAGGAVVDGFSLPAGTVVSYHNYAGNRSEDNFALGNEFHPERFLKEQDVFAKDQFEGFQPFSNGPRNCIGRSLAYHHMRLVVAKILFTFDIELVNPDEDWTDQKVYKVWQKKPLLMRLKPVKSKPSMARI